jgi:hypothetical protein
VFGLFIPQITQAQGTTYVSNLSDPSTGSSPVGSDSWFAADFITGTNASGYVLNSVQLAMMDASGSPSGFRVMLYSDVIFGCGDIPGNSLGTLSGSTDPSTANTYTYTDDSDTTLSPNTVYYIVLTAGTAVANGPYEWSVTSTPSPGYSSYHWGGEVAFLHSSNGSSWNNIDGTYGQFALTATAIPEPGVSGLLGLSGLGFLWHRRKAKAVYGLALTFICSL